MLNPSPSATQLQQKVQDRRKDFDRRAYGLSKEYQELNPNNKPALDLDDVLSFLKSKGAVDTERARRIFDQMNEGKTQQVTKYFSFVGDSVGINISASASRSRTSSSTSSTRRSPPLRR